MRLKLQVEAKPLVGPVLGTIGDCQKKTGPKRYGRAPILLVLLRGGLGSPATCYFQKQSHSSFMSLITRCSMICTVSPIALVLIYFTPGWKRSSSSTGQGPGSEHQAGDGVKSLRGEVRCRD